MDSKKKITISWSGGKDSAFALFKILSSGDYEVVSLHTVINAETRRVGMHGIREELMDRQAESIGLPLTKLYLESSENHVAYEKLMSDYFQHCADQHIEAIVYGDIFLEDLRQFRLKLLKPSGVKAIFPLWEMETGMLIDDFINTGFRTLVCAANADLLPLEMVGETIDQQFIENLKIGVDPCGENGEFHTFVFDGPVFKKPVDFTKGEIVKKTYHYQKLDKNGKSEKIRSSFWFQDLLP